MYNLTIQNYTCGFHKCQWSRLTQLTQPLKTEGCGLGLGLKASGLVLSGNMKLERGLQMLVKTQQQNKATYVCRHVESQVAR